MVNIHFAAKSTPPSPSCKESLACQNSQTSAILEDRTTFHIAPYYFSQTYGDLTKTSALDIYGHGMNKTGLRKMETGTAAYDGEQIFSDLRWYVERIGDAYSFVKLSRPGVSGNSFITSDPTNLHEIGVKGPHVEAAIENSNARNAK